MARRLSDEEQHKLRMLSPMWQRIARGEVDLSIYTDDEILTGKIKMEDGRKTPKPKVYPQTFIDEQVRRGLRVAQTKIRDGSLAGLEFMASLVQDKKASNADRMRAATFLIERQYGKEPQRVQVAQVDKIESLFQDLLNDPDGLLEPGEDDGEQDG